MHAMMMQTQSVLVLIPSVSTHDDSTNHDPWMQATTAGEESYQRFHHAT
jgi:hypothetical protein